jgi:hypothetical protein
MLKTLTQDPTDAAERSERCTPVTKIASLSLGLFTRFVGESTSESADCALHLFDGMHRIAVESGRAIAQPVVI